MTADAALNQAVIDYTALTEHIRDVPSLYIKRGRALARLGNTVAGIALALLPAGYREPRLPVLLLLTFRDLIVSLQATFTPAFVMTYGGPYYATTFAPLLIYELAFDFFDFGLASAAMIVLYLLLALVMAGILNLIDGFKVMDGLG